ncbi:MAG: DUF362 domain-containing protein [Candidatus Heimdallarchaeota archaeon]|nr:MAG: DUF362 domain-containing protein [Candidatus Heimdallarchaeota archaeon]
MVITSDLRNTVVTDTIHSPNLEDSIKQALEPLGGLKSFISRDDSILVKPNFNTGDPFPASTDPEFLEIMLRLLLRHTQNVEIVESSTLRAKTREIIESKVGEVLKELDIPIITEQDFKFTWVDLKSKGAKYLKSVKLPKRILDPQKKLILLPCLKTHFIAQYTGAIKLGVGFMERKQRVRMHMSWRVPAKVAELNLGFKPELVIMDARKIFVTQGPASGKEESPMKILAGTNRVSIDIKGIKIIQSYHEKNKLEGRDPLDVGTIKRALELGIDES